MSLLREFVPICLVCGVLGVGAAGMVRIGQDGRSPGTAPVSSPEERNPAAGEETGDEARRIVIRSQDSGMAGKGELDAQLDRIKKAEEVIQDPHTSVADMADAFVDRDSAFCMLRRDAAAPRGGASTAPAIAAYLDEHAGEHPCDSVLDAPGVVFVPPPDRTVR